MVFVFSRFFLGVTTEIKFFVPLYLEAELWNNVHLGYPAGFSAVTFVESPDPQHKGMNIFLDRSYSTVLCRKSSLWKVVLQAYIFNRIMLYSLTIS